VRISIIALSLFLPLFIASGCGSEPESPGVGPECTLVWTSYRGGAPNIWTMDLPDGSPKQLTNLSEGCGKWGVVLSSDNWVYFGGKYEGDWEVFRIPRDGGQIQRLTNSDQYDGDPTVSPDGERVCFLTKRWYFAQADRELASMSSSGGDVIRLTESEGSDDSPVWSPTGERVAFVHAIDAGMFTVATLDPNSPGTIEYWTGDLEGAYEPRWSPDGSSIICVGSYNGTKDIWRVEIPSGEMVNLTNSNQSDEKPEISPDGSQIAHQVFRDGQWDIAITQMDGSGSLYLTDDSAKDMWPCWSPDGSWVFWVSYRDNDYEIYGAPADGSDGPFRMTDSPGDDIRPQCWPK